MTFRCFSRKGFEGEGERRFGCSGCHGLCSLPRFPDVLTRFLATFDCSFPVFSVLDEILSCEIIMVF